MCLDKNEKTGMSCDFTTICPKRREGKECPYCYVKNARSLGFNAKKEIEYNQYTGQVLRLTQKTIDKLNKAGGLRLFSFGDYMSEHDEDIHNLLVDCEKRGLSVKVITKQLGFVEKFHDYSAIAVINLSIDMVNSGINHEVAMLYRERYNKVRIRCVILRDSDIPNMLFCDVFTFNHGNNGFKNYSHKSNKASKEALIAQYNLHGKTCCNTGNCGTCKLHCAM